MSAAALPFVKPQCLCPSMLSSNAPSDFYLQDVRDVGVFVHSGDNCLLLNSSSHFIPWVPEEQGLSLESIESSKRLPASGCHPCNIRASNHSKVPRGRRIPRYHFHYSLISLTYTLYWLPCQDKIQQIIITHPYFF